MKEEIKALIAKYEADLSVLEIELEKHRKFEVTQLYMECSGKIGVYKLIINDLKTLINE